MSSAAPAPVLPAELQQDHKAVGAKVRVLTDAQESFEGVIFTLDPVANFLVLGTTLEQDTCRELVFSQLDGIELMSKVDTLLFHTIEEQDGAKSRTRIFQLEALEKVEVLEPAPAGLQLTLPAISEEELQRVEQRNKGLAEKALASIGQGVTGEAQAIFDALNKTYVVVAKWTAEGVTISDRVLLQDAV